MEIRITDPVTGGMKGMKLEQYSLVPPSLRLEMLSEWRKGTARTTLAYTLLDFEMGWASSRALAEDAWTFLLEVIPSKGLAVRELARVFGHGSSKYERCNWRKGYAWSLSIDAMWRHLIAGHTTDEDSGLAHAAHVLWHALCLRDFELLKLGTDDRLFVHSKHGTPTPTGYEEPRPECAGCSPEIWPAAAATFIPWEKLGPLGWKRQA